jgi:hypothetical protein
MCLVLNQDMAARVENAQRLNNWQPSTFL